MASERRYYFHLHDADASSDEVDRGKEFYIRHLVDISQICWDHYEKKVAGSAKKQINIRSSQTLYIGSLGPCVYLRYRLATSPSFPLLTSYHKQSTSCEMNTVKDSRIQMLREALLHVDFILHRSQESSHAIHRVSLLEGELVGALAMKIVIGNTIVTLMERKVDSSLIEEIAAAKKRILLFGRKHVLSGVLPLAECEVLYGRCGYLKGALMYILCSLCSKVHSDKRFIICFVTISSEVHSDRDR